ncbi:MAG: hypothetical protein IKT50_05655 [Clostridia bacterium]|nr:hypothetical protein [Clostridia bacterium]
MIHKEKSAVRALITITSLKLADKADKVYREKGIPLHYRLSGVGTAPSEILDLLGIGSSDKGILIGMMDKEKADRMLCELEHEIHFGMPGHGFAFTLPLTAATNHILKIIKQQKNEISERKESIIMPDTKYSLVAAVVAQGYSEDVMSAAREAGARGGTIIHSRRVVDTEEMTVWGLSLQEEKETILIVATEENKLAIMQAISEKYGMQSEAKAAVLSLPIDNVIGLNS